jgi:Kef-type K+ transport system membrane component KefB
MIDHEGDCPVEFLEFARGPALAISLTIFVVGLAWRLYGIFRRPRKPDFSEPRSNAVIVGAARAIVSRMWQHKTFRDQTLVGTVNAYGYHFGLAVVFFGFLPHIAFIQRLTGLTWPAVPGWLFVVAVALVFVGLIYALMARLTSPVLRLLSNFDDYASWVITILPMLTGMAVLSLSFDSPYPATPLNPVPVAIHLLSLELLLVWLPFSKLSHAFLVFFARGTTGAAFARKGAAL